MAAPYGSGNWQPRERATDEIPSAADVFTPDPADPTPGGVAMLSDSVGNGDLPLPAVGDDSLAGSSVIAQPVVAPSDSGVGLAGMPAGGSSRSPRQSPSALPRVRLHDVWLHAITEQQCIGYILDELDAGRGGTVITPNLDHIRRCSRDVTYAALVSEASLIVPDGMPLVWASWLQGTPLPERVAGSSMISTLTAAATQRGRSVFLLGGDPGTSDAAAAVLRQMNPGARIVGTCCPTVGFEFDPARLSTVEAALRAAKPDIVFVALGSPKQERLISRIHKVLPDAWWLGVGVSFSFLCGHVQRAPMWAQRMGLEWAHRLGQEPRRLFKRYLVQGVPFAAEMLGRSAMAGLRARLTGDGRRAKLRARPMDPLSSATFNHPPARCPEPPAADQAPDLSVAAAIAALPAVDETAAVAAASTSIAAPLPIQNAFRATAIARPTFRRSNGRSAWANHLPELDEAAIAGLTGADAGHDRSGTLRRLRAFVLLGGSVRVTSLRGAIGRSTLDLPLDETTGSILNHWLANAAEVAQLAGLPKLPTRVLVDRSSPEPISAAVKHFGSFRVERDRSEFRGTGGALRDLADASDFEDDDLILVANGTQVLIDPLTVLAAALDRKRADVAIIGHQDGTPSGLQLVRCKALRQLRDEGFVDFKEQGLSAIAATMDVRVVHCRRPTALPIWSLSDYIQALRVYHRRRGANGEPAGRPAVDPLGEDWQPTFSIVEPGAIVDPTAKIHDSVVLAGGTVEAGAVLVRSVVCGSGHVKRDRSLVDEFCVDRSDLLDRPSSIAERSVR